MALRGIVLCAVALLGASGCSDERPDPLAGGAASPVGGTSGSDGNSGNGGKPAGGSAGALAGGSGAANAAAGQAPGGSPAQGGSESGGAAGVAGTAIAGSGGGDLLQGPFQLLVFTRTIGTPHDSIPAGVALVTALGMANDFSVTTTDDPTQFNAATLAQYAAVVFMNTKGDVLDAAQQAAFEAYIRSGKGYVGVHSASFTEADWPWYGELIGAYFTDHPAIQPVTIRIETHAHPSTAALPDEWMRTEEPYNFARNPRADVTVLATLDESSYSGGTMGADHPISWYREFDGGRAWYTALGHTTEGYSEELFGKFLLGGIEWAAGRKR